MPPLETCRNRHCPTGGHKARPYSPALGLLVGAATSRPRVDEGIDPYSGSGTFTGKSRRNS